MAEYHVGAGAFGIYAGTLDKTGTLWKNKTVCTDESINAVRDHMVLRLLGGYDKPTAISSGYEWTLDNGQVVELRVTLKGISTDEKNDHEI